MFPAPEQIKWRIGIGGSRFDLDTAQALARASAAAYSKAHEAEAMAVQAGATGFYFVDHKISGTQLFVAVNRTNVVIAFRGTDEIKDWHRDARFRREPVPTGELHRGFLAAFESVQHEIIWALNELGAGRRLWITGHSLGGALATICASYLNREGFSVEGVYTFGAPRVGDRSFAKNYDAALRQRTFRIVHQADVVTRVPGVLIGYRHVGQEIFFDAFGEMILNPPWYSKIPSDLRGLAVELDPILPISSVVSAPFKNHFMDAYLKKLSCN